MSLPITRTLPTVPDLQDMEQVQKYLQDLHFELQDMYQTQTQNINGFFRNNADVDGSEWLPTVEGTVVAGSPTYNWQIGNVLRQGLLTFCWFNVNWTTLGGASGNIRLNLPYKVAKPTTSVAGVNSFIGNAGSGNLNWSGRTSFGCIALADTYKLRFVGYGSGTSTTDIPIGPNAFVNGAIVYIGVEDE